MFTIRSRHEESKNDEWEEWASQGDRAADIVEVGLPHNKLVINNIEMQSSVVVLKQHPPVC